jgi:tetratricopeptide (TPR) repeat protein
MTENSLFPQYIHRPQETLILNEISRVRADGQSRVVLLYGPGGVGKTHMVRELAESRRNADDAMWVSPVDVDDPEYWLLSGLERHVMDELDPAKLSFRDYRDYLGRLPAYSDPEVSFETLISHLGRIKRVFVECYQEFIQSTRKPVVIVLDTVETIRGTYLLITLTQWIKKLPGTLFILVGRPMGGESGQEDPIRAELSDPHQGLPVTPISLGDFPEKAARAYLAASAAAGGVTEEEREKLVRLSLGHPLWLAFTISYLWERGVPEEARATTLAEIDRKIPYTERMTQAGLSLHEDFKRRLMTPYREAGFWPEAVRRLAVVRQSISESAWQRIMSDVALPGGVSNQHEAWQQLLTRPWIRLRANGHQVTLHDAVAEELAQRIIPVHDQSKAWRRNLWRRSVEVYRELIDAAAVDLTAKEASTNYSLREVRERQRETQDATVTDQGRAFVEEVSQLDAQQSDLDQLRVARLYYQLLSDHEAGCQTFLTLFNEARRRNDVVFLDLLAYEMQRFLPGGESLDALDDVIGEAIAEFRTWLEDPTHSDLHLDIALAMADYLIRNEKPETAIDLLTDMPEPHDDHERRYRLSIQRGNAHMRIPNHMNDAREHFRSALAAAEMLRTDDRYNLIAKAHKELGFYYRNAGMWREANDAYRRARDALGAAASKGDPYNYREEIASIQTNWAYVKGLVGSYRYGQNLIESAITIRHRIGNHIGEGNSWSVCGEVYRYERRFQRAWEAYANAQEIFDLSKKWPWLGLVYQEQAICLFQAAEEGINLLSTGDPVKEARRLILQALDICHDLAIRNYPSALNRAGRIFGRDDIEAGFDYLTEGIESARQLSDGWFYFANVIEYVELSYRAWTETRQDVYLRKIDSRVADVEEAMGQYLFADLRGRWLLVQGHLAVHRWLGARDDRELDAALANYREGFALIAQDYVGSSGASAIPGEFRKFRQLFEQLPQDIQARWLTEFRSSWRRSGEEGEQGSSTLLLARVEELG